MKSLITIFLFCCTLLSYSQNNDTIPQIKHQGECNPHFHQLYVPSALIISGIISEVKIKQSLNFELYKERNTDIPHFKTSADDYLQYSPILLAYGFLSGNCNWYLATIAALNCLLIAYSTTSSSFDLHNKIPILGFS